MITETKKVFALAALIVATGVVTVELGAQHGSGGRANDHDP